MKDVEEEPAGSKKTTGGRGCVGSKRSRATKVHNLSKRQSLIFLELSHIVQMLSLSYRLQFIFGLALVR
ncbi:hypothetical protein JHK87_047954 [Glycine soja]|nr:hypothetical protein JHK87_047954 [Glycine soja]